MSYTVGKGLTALALGAFLVTGCSGQQDAKPPKDPEPKPSTLSEAIKAPPVVKSPLDKLDPAKFLPLTFTIETAALQGDGKRKLSVSTRAYCGTVTEEGDYYAKRCRDIIEKKINIMADISNAITPFESRIPTDNPQIRKIPLFPSEMMKQALVTGLPIDLYVVQSIELVLKP